MSEPFKIFAIKITQPLGTFYVFKMKASDLNSVSYSSRAKYKKSGFFNNAFSPITGTQRELDEDREKEIARYINSVECAIPNSIVLGANISEAGNLIDDESKWFVNDEGNGIYTLTIPKNKKMASIIDGQHRLAGCMKSDRKDLELLCAVYLDLPLPYQAYLFASINANQKKVSKSLAYELYGFGSDNEDKYLWSPEKLAVSIVRKINFDKYSKVKGQIHLGAQSHEEQNGYLSLAAMVESVLSLITNNPKKDRDVILHYRNKSGRSSLEKNKNIPLRDLYISNKDDEIEKVVCDFVNFIFDEINYDAKSYLYKTIGIQSLFTLLKKYLQQKPMPFNINEFKIFCAPIWRIDFSNDFFTASGIGKSRITNTLLAATNLVDLDKIRNEEDRHKIEILIN